MHILYRNFVALKGRILLITFAIILIIIALILWLRYDYVYGLRMQKKKQTKKMQVTRYANVTLLSDGDQFIDELFSDIKAARHHIHIQFFILKDDFIGKKFIRLLIDKQKQGVEIRLLVDFLGFKLKKKSMKQLKKAGVLITLAHKPKFPLYFFTLNRRNHRKIVVIDGKIGYMGGFNIGDEYLGRDPRFGYWRDYHLRMTGDGVQDLQKQFIEDWNQQANNFVGSDRYFPSLLKGSTPIRIVPTNGAFLENSFIDLIKQAKERLYIATPYYIPGEKLQAVLLAAANRGVNVKIIVPKVPDHPFVKEASYPYFKHLILAGVQIYQYYRGFFHGKVVIVDDEMCDIGTANFDKRSFHLNCEINCLIYDTAFLKQVLKEIEYDISISEPLTLEAYEQRSLFFKGKEKIATLLSPFL